jgi:hypothetical protein
MFLTPSLPTSRKAYGAMSRTTKESVTPNRHLVSVEEYLAGELASPIKHEYVGGVLYAMAGARNAHNLIASNALVALGARLRGKPCRAYNSDTKIRLRLPTQVRFYYPDPRSFAGPTRPPIRFRTSPPLSLKFSRPERAASTRVRRRTPI